MNLSQSSSSNSPSFSFSSSYNVENQNNNIILSSSTTTTTTKRLTKNIQPRRSNRRRTLAPIYFNHNNNNDDDHNKSQLFSSSQNDDDDEDYNDNEEDQHLLTPSNSFLLSTTTATSINGKTLSISSLSNQSNETDNNYDDDDDDEGQVVTSDMSISTNYTTTTHLKTICNGIKKVHIDEEDKNNHEYSKGLRRSTRIRKKRKENDNSTSGSSTRSSDSSSSSKQSKASVSIVVDDTTSSSSKRQSSKSIQKRRRLHSKRKGMSSSIIEMNDNSNMDVLNELEDTMIQDQEEQCYHGNDIEYNDVTIGGKINDDFQDTKLLLSSAGTNEDSKSIVFEDSDADDGNNNIPLKRAVTSTRRRSLRIQSLSSSNHVSDTNQTKAQGNHETSKHEKPKMNTKRISDSRAIRRKRRSVLPQRFREEETILYDKKLSIQSNDSSNSDYPNKDSYEMQIDDDPHNERIILDDEKSDKDTSQSLQQNIVVESSTNYNYQDSKTHEDMVKSKTLAKKKRRRRSLALHAGGLVSLEDIEKIGQQAAITRKQGKGFAAEGEMNSNRKDNELNLVKDNNSSECLISSTSQENCESKIDNSNDSACLDVEDLHSAMCEYFSDKTLAMVSVPRFFKYYYL